jgi:hypothetical protein
VVETLTVAFERRVGAIPLKTVAEKRRAALAVEQLVQQLVLRKTASDARNSINYADNRQTP